MTKQVINIGLSANDHKGDPLRTAFTKINENFTEVYAAVQEGINVDQVNADWSAVSGVAQILNKPTIPTNTNQLTNGAGFITSEDLPDASRLVNGAYTVSLNSVGALNLPGDTGFLYSVANQVYLNSDVNSYNSIDIITNGDTVLRNQRDVKIIADSDGSGHNWIFDRNGELTLPGAIHGGSSAVTLKATNPLNPLQTKNWSFDGLGKITFPDSTQQTTAYTGNGDGIKYTSTLDAFSGNFTIASEQLVLVYNNGVASRTIFLPATPTNGQTVTIKKSAAFTSWTVVVDGNGKNIDGGATVSFNNAWGYITLTYSTANSYNHWFVVGGNYSTV